MTRREICVWAAMMRCDESHCQDCKDYETYSDWDDIDLLCMPDYD